MTMGEYVKCLRKANKLTYRELSKKSGISKTTLCEIENNIVTNPTIKTLKTLAPHLGIAPVDLFRVAVSEEVTK